MNARELRSQLRWSQKEMAAYLGCDQATVSRIESGREPSGPVARLLRLLMGEARAKRIATDAAERSGMMPPCP